MECSTYSKVTFQQNTILGEEPSTGFSIQLFALELLPKNLVDIIVINSRLFKRPDSMTILSRDVLQNFRQQTLHADSPSFKPPSSDNKVSRNINTSQDKQNLIAQLKQNYLQPP